MHIYVQHKVNAESICLYIRTATRTHAHTHARTHAHAHMHTHRHTLKGFPTVFTCVLLSKINQITLHTERDNLAFESSRLSVKPAYRHLTLLTQYGRVSYTLFAELSTIVQENDTYQRHTKNKLIRATSSCRLPQSKYHNTCTCLAIVCL